MARRQQEKTLQTQEELMAAALELFQEKGYFATTIAEITAKAGYAKGSFYRHWQGKDELILKLIERKLAEHRARRAERLADAASLDEVLDAIWDFLEAILEDKSWARVFLEFTIHASRDEALKAELGKSAYRLSEHVFADLVARFVTTGYPPEKLAALNTALFEGFLIQSVLGSGSLGRDDIRSAARTLLLDLAVGAPA